MSAALYCSMLFADIGIQGLRISPARQEPEAKAGVEEYDDSVSISEIRKRESRRVTAHQINAFHVHFVESTIHRLPPPVRISYKGLVAFDDGRRMPRFIGIVGRPITWSVTDIEKTGLFEIIISTRKSSKAVAVVRIDDQDIYVIPAWIDGGQSVDDRLPGLGGRSVRQVLAMMEPTVF